MPREPLIILGAGLVAASIAGLCGLAALQAGLLVGALIGALVAGLLTLLR